MSWIRFLFSNMPPIIVESGASSLSLEDSSVAEEIFLTLFSGAMLLTVPNVVKCSPSILAEVLFRRQFTSILQITPTLFHRFSLEDVHHCLLGCDSHVKILAFGGERCPDHKYLASLKETGNATSIFNLYGVTEVSSWATCHCVCGPYALSEHDSDQGKVPLGEPLLGTKLEVRNEYGEAISKGRGSIWIGGDYRVCLLQEEMYLKPRCMRHSGDIGFINECGEVFYSGRSDRQTKRLGHRISLEFVEQAIESLDSVKACVVADTTLRRSLPQKPIKTVSSFGSSGFSIGEEQGHIFAFIVPRGVENVLCSEGKQPGQIAQLYQDIFDKLKLLLHPSLVPDEIILVKLLPFTRHGKVDVESLLSFAEPEIFMKTQIHNSVSNWMCGGDSLTVDVIEEMLKETASHVLAMKTCANNIKVSDFGATSFDILRFTDRFELHLRTYIEEKKYRGVLAYNVTDVINCLFVDILDKLMSSTLHEVAVHIISKLSILLEKEKGLCKQYLGDSSAHTTGFVSESPVTTYYKGQKHVYFDTSPVGRKQLKVEDVCDQEDLQLLCQTSNCLDKSESYHREIGEDISSLKGGKKYRNGRLVSRVFESEIEGGQMSVEPCLSSQDITLRFSVQWKVCTGKCVDASPLITWRTHETDQRVSVYIGSHSGKFFAIDLVSGSVLWIFQLEHRVESSGCVSKCGLYIAVGCYDGALYILNACNGTLHCKFNTSKLSEESSNKGLSNLIKSSPCVDPGTGLIWFGSHDHHIYAVNIQMKCFIFKVYPGGGSCFAAPCVDADARIVYAATLQGKVVAISADTGSISWTYRCPKPVFSSLTLCRRKCVTSSASLVVVGCVDGSVYSLESDGSLNGQMCTEKPVFSSCSIIYVPDDTTHYSTMRVLAGSHDQCVYCWDEQYNLRWKLQLDSEIYSTPFASRLRYNGTKESPSSLCTASDSIVLDKSVTNLSDVLCVCVCSRLGYIYLVNFKTGCKIGQYQLPGEIFSSPTVFDNSIIVGCRDDSVYCIKVELLYGSE